MVSKTKFTVDGHNRITIGVRKLGEYNVKAFPIFYLLD